MITIDGLWNSTNPAVWENALQRYWEFVQPRNRELEDRMEKLNPDCLKPLCAEKWYEFLRDEYFRWKFAPNRYATTTKWLKTHYEGDNLSLLRIKEKLFAFNKDDVKQGLTIAMSVKGLGTAGASGLLAVLFPRHFGTVDQFVVKALSKVPELPEIDKIRAMKPLSLKPRDGVVLISVMRCKAAELNKLFGNGEWTPRKIDKILWTYGRENDPPKADVPASRKTTSSTLRPTNHEMIAFAVKDHHGETLTTDEIRGIVLRAYPNFNKGSLLPNDHARGNKGSCSCAGTVKRIFDCIETGRYRVL